MSHTDSPADRIPAHILRAQAEAADDAVAKPVERAIRAIPPAYMTPEVALRIVECLAAAMINSAWKHPMEDITTALMEEVEHPLWAMVQRLKEQA